LKVGKTRNLAAIIVTATWEVSIEKEHGERIKLGLIILMHETVCDACGSVYFFLVKYLFWI
jgi:hypothetical protein